VIREIFHDHFGQALPNKAHEVLEAARRLECLTTRNIDMCGSIAGDTFEEGPSAGSCLIPGLVTPGGQDKEC
jgi:hypothetical protein